MTEEIYFGLIEVFYIILFSLFLGYMVTVIQESLKNNDIPPKFKNLKKLFVLGIKASTFNILIINIPGYIFKIESIILLPFNLLAKFIPEINKATHWVVLDDLIYYSN